MIPNEAAAGRAGLHRVRDSVMIQGVIGPQKLGADGERGPGKPERRTHRREGDHAIDHVESANSGRSIVHERKPPRAPRHASSLAFNANSTVDCPESKKPFSSTLSGHSEFPSPSLGSPVRDFWPSQDAEMFNEDAFAALDRKLKLHARGILTSQEVVDRALGFLAYQAQFELVEPVTRLLMERFADEVERWVECSEGNSQGGSPWMPYNDSRLISEFHGGIAGGEYTSEQRSEFVRQMRINVQQVANVVRGILSNFESTS